MDAPTFQPRARAPEMQAKGLGWKPGRGTAPRKLADITLATPEDPDRYWWSEGWWGDQGQTSQCVIYSWLHLLHDGPVTLPLGTPRPLFDPLPAYQEGQAIDGTPLTDAHSGLTCNAGAQVMRRRGLIGEYRWAETVDEVVRWVLTSGPCVVGAWWRLGMDRPDPTTGRAVYDGTYLGGHQWKVDGVNTRTQRLRCKNSWGRRWGRRGAFTLSFLDLDHLLAEGGEVCMMRELKQPRLPTP